MWSPVELHSDYAARCGLSEALTAALANHAHFEVVGARKIVEKECDPSRAEETVALLDGCAAAYIGARHGLPVAPFCGFSFVGENVAHLEYLIDYESQGGERGRNAGLYAFVLVLFHDFPAINTVVSPLAVAGDDLPEFDQRQTGEFVHFLRR